MGTESTLTRRLVLVCLACALLAALGCRVDMHDQAKIEALERSTLFADGGGARPIPAHTVARGRLYGNAALHRGVGPDGNWVTSLPVELDGELLERGRQRFEIFCTPCHAATGSGRGMIVERGFKQPPSYHEQRLREMPIGYFYDVISNGYGQMSGYSAQIHHHEDRWAIAAWIRVLQRSQNVQITELSQEERRMVADGVRLGGQSVVSEETSDGDHGEGESH